MKNIFEILAALGIVIPEDKKQDITKQVAENYKTVAEFEKVKSRLEVERDNYKDSLDTAQNSLNLRQTNKNHRIYGGFLLYTRFLHDCVQYLHRTFFLSWVEVRVGVPCH